MRGVVWRLRTSTIRLFFNLAKPREKGYCFGLLCPRCSNIYGQDTPRPFVASASGSDLWHIFFEQRQYATEEPSVRLIWIAALCCLPAGSHLGLHGSGSSMSHSSCPHRLGSQTPPSHTNMSLAFLPCPPHVPVPSGMGVCAGLVYLTRSACGH